jgi:hypothetical protein
LSIYDDLPPHSRLDGCFAGEFAAPLPTTLADPAFAIVYFLSDQHKIGPMPWSPRKQDTVSPAVGDKCLVAYDEHENPYIIAWWPPGSFSL